MTEMGSWELLICCGCDVWADMATDGADVPEALDTPEDAVQAAPEAPIIDAAAERVTVRLSREIHYQGSIPRTGVELHMSKLSRTLKPGDVLEHAVRNGWLTISDGLRVLPGDVFPSLEDAALRYVPASVEA